MLLVEEAQNCRREAQRMAGKPEAPFLLHLAEAFEDLASKRYEERAAQDAPVQVLKLKA